jgi:hypothetical protein
VVSPGLPQKVIDQIRNAGLPTSGQYPFVPMLTTNRKGDQIIEKRAVSKGRRIGKPGYVDVQGRVWIKDRAHSGMPAHWDVQIDGGDSYIRVDLDGNEIP